MEGALHKFLKETVADELQRQNYSIYYEPLESPLKRLWWNSYRPDVFAVKSRKSNLDVIFVECETKPNRKRNPISPSSIILAMPDPTIKPAAKIMAIMVISLRVIKLPKSVNVAARKVKKTLDKKPIIKRRKNS